MSSGFRVRVGSCVAGTSRIQLRYLGILRSFLVARNWFHTVTLLLISGRRVRGEKYAIDRKTQKAKNEQQDPPLRFERYLATGGFLEPMGVQMGEDDFGEIILLMVLLTLLGQNGHLVRVKTIFDLTHPPEGRRRGSPPLCF